MAEAVVDVLEVVEVDEEGTDEAVGPAAGQRVLDPVLEQGPIGEVGQRVVERHVRQLLLERPPFRVIPGIEHVARHVGILEAVGDHDLRPARTAIGVHDPAREDPGRSRLEVGEGGEHRGQVLRRDERGQPPILQRLRPVAEDVPDRRALIADDAVRGDHRDHVGGVLDERPEAGLAALELVGLHRDRRLEVTPEGDVLEQGVDLSGDHQHDERRTEGDEDVGEPDPPGWPRPPGPPGRRPAGPTGCRRWLASATRDRTPTPSARSRPARRRR